VAMFQFGSMTKIVTIVAHDGIQKKYDYDDAISELTFNTRSSTRHGNRHRLRVLETT